MSKNVLEAIAELKAAGLTKMHSDYLRLPKEVRQVLAFFVLGPGKLHRGHEGEPLYEYNLYFTPELPLKGKLLLIGYTADGDWGGPPNMFINEEHQEVRQVLDAIYAVLPRYILEHSVPGGSKIETVCEHGLGMEEDIHGLLSERAGVIDPVRRHWESHWLFLCPTKPGYVLELEKAAGEKFTAVEKDLPGRVFLNAPGYEHLVQIKGRKK